MQGKVRVEVLEKMFVMIVLLLAKFCFEGGEALGKEGQERGEDTYGFLGIY